MSIKQATRLVAAAACAALLVTSCDSTTNSQPDTAATRTPTNRTTSPSPSEGSSARQALAAYRAMWTDVQVLSATANYTDPRLGEHLAGQAYTTISENMSVEKAHGIIALGAPVLHPSIVTATSTRVTMRDCLDDSHWLTYYAATHKLSDTAPGGHRYVAATVTDENGAWKVTVLDTRGEGTCT
ncbi:MAG: hypothetical protein ACRDRL_17795 [Sciscionella sp.]